MKQWNHYFKGICRFTVSRHFWIRKVLETREMTKSLDKNDFSRDLVVSPVSRHFWIRKVSKNRKMTKILCEAKPLLTGGTKRPWIWQGGHWVRKVSGNKKTTKSFVDYKPLFTQGTERPFRCLDDHIDINICQKCQYIDNRYSISIYRTGLALSLAQVVLLTRLTTQCAAVTTQFLPISIPPQDFF